MSEQAAESSVETKPCRVCGVVQPLSRFQRHHGTYYELDCRTCYQAKRRARHVSRRKSLAQRFWEKVEKTDGCWLWRAGLFSTGYGKFKVGKSDVNAHRVAWMLAHGHEPQVGLHVCHTCDNPPCVRPDHLFLGTRSDNMRDCAAKGRNAMQRRPWRSVFATGLPKDKYPRGERQGNARLTTEIVNTMRSLAAAGVKPAELARTYGITTGHARNVIAGKSWSHLTNS